MSPRPDQGAPARLASALDALAVWASELTDAQRGRASRRGGSVGELAERALARRSRLGSLTPPQALHSEVGLVSDADALAEAVPESPPNLGRASVAAAVRTTLGALAAAHPGHLVEVRVPPWGAVQIGMPGVASVHKRGTPPNVVETDAVTWLRLVEGSLGWAEALASGKVLASGAHAQLGDLLRQA